MGDWIWIAFALLALQPVIRQRVLVAARSRLLRRLETKRGSRVISLVPARRR
jgi:hypothetical protein